MSVIRKITRRLQNQMAGLPANFNREKMHLIEKVFGDRLIGANSFADLGAIWNIDGAYTIYTLKNYDIERGNIVDTDFTDSFIQKTDSYSNLNRITGNFGDPSIADQVNTVDAVFFFDVLLHQVKPDWDEILEMYASRTKYFLIYNQQWVGSDNTVRLLDLGKEEYYNNVPDTIDKSGYEMLFDNMYDMHPQHNRIWRDIHNVWQWGITDSDLLAKLDALGFEQVYFKDCGQYGNLKNFRNHAFIFRKRA